MVFANISRYIVFNHKDISKLEKSPIFLFFLYQHPNNTLLTDHFLFTKKSKTFARQNISLYTLYYTNQGSYL